MADETMHIEVSERDGTIILKPEGDVDMSRSPVLRASLREANDKRPKRLVVDLSLVEYMDSSGLATLVEAMKHAKDKKVQLVLCAMHEKVHAIFEIARLHSYFRIEPSLDEALV